MARAIIGNWRSSGYTFDTGTRTVTMYGVPTLCDNTTITMVELLRPSVDNTALDGIMKVFSILYGNVAPTTPSAALVAGTPTAGGSVTSGIHLYKYSFVINGFETLLSPASGPVDTTTNKTVPLSSIPLGVTGTTARNIYRTNAGGSTYYLIATIADNTTTVYSDTSADNTTILAPTTTTCYDFTWITPVNSVTTPTTASGDKFQITIDYQDNTESQELGYQNTAEINPLKLEQDTEVNIASAQTITTSWVVLGSAFSMQSRNVARCYCLYTHVAGSTGIRIKVLGKKTAGGTTATSYPVDVVFDKPERVYEIVDDIATINVGVITYQLQLEATQYFYFDVYTQGVSTEVEILIAGKGITGSTQLTLDVMKSYSQFRADERKFLPQSTPIHSDMDSASTDAFGRWRVSSPTTRLDTQFQYNEQPLFWQTQTVTGGSITHLPNESMVSMVLDTTSGAKVIRQTYQYFRYTSGKSQLILETFILGTGVANVTKSIGLFDARNGIFLEQVGTTLNIVLRTYTSGSMAETRVTQTAWNTDRLNGSGKSGRTLDVTKAQILVIDYEWLGVGRVRVGFNIDGKYYLAHIFNNANNVTSVYMTTPHLPLRYEILNTAASAGATLKQICSTVITEDGGGDELGITQVASNGITSITGINARVPVLSIRPKATFGTGSQINRGQILPIELSIYSSQNIYWELVWGGTLTTTPSFASVGANSITEKDIASTVITGGEVVASGFVTATNTVRGSLDKSIFIKLPITLDIDGANPRNLSVVVQDFTTNADVNAALTFIELY